MTKALAALALLLAACPSDDVSGADGGDGGDAGDGGTARGLAIGWNARPDLIPGDVTDEIHLDGAVFSLANVRVIGDAGTGDPRTSVAAYGLAWGPSATPADLLFPDAPTGLYSRVSFSIEAGPGDTYAYALTGTVDLPGGRAPFVVRDRAPLAVALAYQVTVPPGGGAHLGVRFRLDDVLEDVDFAQAPTVGGVRTIEGDAAIRARLLAEIDADSD